MSALTVNDGQFELTIEQRRCYFHPLPIRDRSFCTVMGEWHDPSSRSAQSRQENTQQFVVRLLQPQTMFLSRVKISQSPFGRGAPTQAWQSLLPQKRRGRLRQEWQLMGHRERGRNGRFGAHFSSGLASEVGPLPDDCPPTPDGDSHLNGTSTLRRIRPDHRPQEAACRIRRMGFAPRPLSCRPKEQDPLPAGSLWASHRL